MFSVGVWLSWGGISLKHMAAGEGALSWLIKMPADPCSHHLKGIQAITHVFTRECQSPWMLAGLDICTADIVSLLSLAKSALPRWLSSKESACQCRTCRFYPWVRKIPSRRKWQPTPLFLPGKSHGQRSLVGYSPWGRREVDTPEWLSTHIYTIRTTLSSSGSKKAWSQLLITVRMSPFFLLLCIKAWGYHILPASTLPWPLHTI